jgi:Mg-chelatase subunit ChlD
MNRDIESILKISNEYPRAVGDMLENQQMALSEWEKSNPGLLKKLLVQTWDRLETDIKKSYLPIIINMIHKVSNSEMLRNGAPTGEYKTVPFNFEGDEIELDRTIEAIIENPVPSYRNIYISEKKKRKKASIIIIDASGSMQGENLSIAAIATASMAMNLDRKDEYGIVLFSEEVNQFKRVYEQKEIDEVIKGILNIQPRGRTNIGIGLLAGLREIQRSTIDQKIGILLTDGRHNFGNDPISLARKYPQLHVINLPGGKPDLSKKLAKCGKGHFIPLKNIYDVPKAIVKCLN